jgi:hydrogenase maturation protease
MKKIGIIGIGNPLRNDDGIGIILLEKLDQIQNTIFGKIELVDGGTGGMNLIHKFPKYDIIVILDAVDFKGRPGDSKFFNIEEIHNKKISIKTSTHCDDILKIISLSKHIEGKKPEKFIFFGIQPKDTSHGTDLSIELKNNINLYLKNLKLEIEKISED